MDTRSRRWQQKARTRQALADAAERLFAERGFDAVTTEEIAQAAGVTQRTFFRHFAVKEAVVYGDQETLLARLREALAERPPDEPILHSIREAVLRLAEGHDEAGRASIAQLRLARSNPSVAAYGRAVAHMGWVDAIADFVAERLGVDRNIDMRPQLIAEAASGAVSAAITRWLAIDGREPLLVLAAHALDLLDSGFGLEE